MKKRKIGFFGGSFDPLHLGHLNFIVFAIESQKLDHLYICPVNCSPYKKEAPPIATGKERLEMVQIAISGLDNVSVLDCELTREGPSYTFDTIKELMEKEDADYYLLLSDDAVAHFDGWKECRALLDLARPLLAPRSPRYLEKIARLPDDLKKHFINNFVDLPIMEISSTTIRDRLKRKLYCEHLVPYKVLDYIYRNQLYYFV